MVFAESMAAGTPVVGFDAPGARDIIIHESNGFLVNTAQEMCNAIELLVSDKRLYTTCSQKAFNVGKAYHPILLSDTLVKLYKKACR